MKILQSTRRFGRGLLLLAACLLQLFIAQSSHADFINGGFEDTYTPSSSNTYNPINGWTLTGYLFNGNATSIPPTSMATLSISTPTTPGGITDIVSGPTQTIDDWFLAGALPTPTLLLPATALQSVMINLRSVHQTFTVSGSQAKPVGWTTVNQQATSVSQQMTVVATDVDPIDHLVHIRFKGAPVLENPMHLMNQQPFFAVQLNNITTGRTNANPLFFQWNFAAQPGIPWQTLTTAGTNSGSNTSYYYTDLQAYDIAPGNAFVHVGDLVELVVLASGCSLGGHDGHFYLDDVQTSIPAGLWVSATGPQSSTPGSNITYTYTYTNASTVAVNNVQVVAHMPQQGNPVNLPALETTFVSVTTPTTGVAPFCSGTAPVTCYMGTLQPGETGTFQLTVNIPADWAISSGPVNNGNYPISGQGVNPLLGPLVQTNLLDSSALSNLVANTGGLPGTATQGVPYTGTFTCSNISVANASGDAPNASCDINNLPEGLAVSGCTISPSNLIWSQPQTIAANQTVTCSVTGTPTVTGTVTALLTTNASNNANSTENYANAPITVNAPKILATLNGVVISSPAVVHCGRPVLLGPLSIPGPGATSYAISSQTGDVSCLISQTGTQIYFRMRGNQGSCTIVATQNGISSALFTVVAA